MKSATDTDNRDKDETIRVREAEIEALRRRVQELELDNAELRRQLKDKSQERGANPGQLWTGDKRE